MGSSNADITLAVDRQQAGNVSSGVRVQPHFAQCHQEPENIKMICRRDKEI